MKKSYKSLVCNLEFVLDHFLNLFIHTMNIDFKCNTRIHAIIQKFGSKMQPLQRFSKFCDTLNTKKTKE